MAAYSIYALGATQISISGGQTLSGDGSGDGSQLVGQTITLLDNAWEPIAVNDTDQFFADSQGSQLLDGPQTFDGVSYAGGLRVEAEYTITVTDGTNTYTLIGFNINEPGESPSTSTVEGFAFIDDGNGFPPIGVELTVISTEGGPRNNASGGTPAGTYATPPCFAPGTRIRTPSGSRLVETLKPGDLVTTATGPQALIWVGRASYTAQELRDNPDARPIHIAKAALGHGRPCRALTVSPQHRMLVRGADVELMFATPTALVAARHLLGKPGVTRAGAEGGAVYIHLLFDAHEVIFANGAPTESFQPGALTLAALGPGDRSRLMALRPDLVADAEPPVVARLRGWEGALTRDLV